MHARTLGLSAGKRCVTYASGVVVLCEEASEFDSEAAFGSLSGSRRVVISCRRDAPAVNCENSRPFCLDWRGGVQLTSDGNDWHFTIRQGRENICVRRVDLPHYGVYDWLVQVTYDSLVHS